MFLLSPPPAAAAAPAASLPGLGDRTADAVAPEEGGKAAGFRNTDTGAPKLERGLEPAFRATGAGTGTLRTRGPASGIMGPGKP